MKNVVASLIAASVALVSVHAFAQDTAASPAAATAPAKAKKQHRKLKHHGKRAQVEEGASAAGTADKGSQN
jgi:hypothetical protein